jgi:predicted metalloprotease with PDZ domain
MHDGKLGWIRPIIMRNTLLKLRGLRHANIVALAFLLALPLSAQQAVEYEISFPNAANYVGNVTATFRGIPPGTTLEARMARWSPGRYSPTGFAKNVFDVRAEDGQGRRLAVTQPHPHGWDVAGHDGTVRITYSVFGDRTDGTYLGIDNTHAHMNIPATFMFAPAMSGAPVRLKILPRPGWRIATQLAPTSDSMLFTAPNMQWFMDSPTEAGPIMFSAWQETHGGRRSTIRLAVHHPGTQAEVDSLAMLTRRVVAEQVAVFGEMPVFDHGTYTFIADYLPWASGDGMEHRNSTILTSTRSLTGHANRMAVLGPISHEFFHAWNVERLRSKALEPFDFERDNMSPDLWFGEGFTNYYGPLTIRRAGLYTDDEFLSRMGGAIVGVVNSPARKHGSAVAMSMAAPFFDGAAWRDPTRAPATFLSYYTWGSTIGIALDLMLRQRFNTTLDAYMRLSWREFGRHQSADFAPTRTYTTADLRITLGQLTKDTAFANNFFRRYIEGSEVPDYTSLLAQAGFLLRAASVTSPALGGVLQSDSAGVRIVSRISSGSLYAAGLDSGDVIRVIEGIPVTEADSVVAVVGRGRIGDTLRLGVTRRAGRATIPMILTGSPQYTISTYEKAGMPVSNAMKRFKQAWLGSKARR